MQYSAFPPADRVLSLCCGHGVFENMLRCAGVPPTVASIDGQFLNLLITRRYADHGGSYICHDIQFPPAQARRIAANCANAKVEILDTGHECPVEDPQAVTGAIEAFLAEPVGPATGS